MSGYFTDDYLTDVSVSSPVAVKPIVFPKQRSSSRNSVSSIPIHQIQQIHNQTVPSAHTMHLQNTSVIQNQQNHPVAHHHNPDQIHGIQSVHQIIPLHGSIHLSSQPPLHIPSLSSTVTNYSNLVHTPTNARSMSIVSMDSPSNSIVSADDNIIRPTRNNSSTSLVSLVSQLTPSTSQNTPILPSVHDHLGPANDFAISNKLKIASSTMISDDDSELDSSTPSRTILKPVLRSKAHVNFLVHQPRNHDNESTTPHFPTPNKDRVDADFKFKYTPSPAQSSSPKTLLDLEKTADPLSLNKSNHPVQNSKQAMIPSPSTSTSVNHKKVKTTPATPTKTYLKKIYSKELQHELMGQLLSPLLGPASSALEKPSSPLKKGSDISEQNKLITKLNQKWNRSMLKDKDKKPRQQEGKKVSGSSPSRKRSRGYSFGDVAEAGEADYESDFDDYKEEIKDKDKDRSYKDDFSIGY